MSEKLTQERFVKLFDKAESIPLWNAIEADREAIRAEVTAEILKDAIIPDWETHEGCSGARIVYEYGSFGDVSWDSGPGDAGCRLILHNGGYVKPGTWYRSPAPKTRPMTREEKIDALHEYFQPPVLRSWEKITDEMLDGMMAACELNAEVEA